MKRCKKTLVLMFMLMLCGANPMVLAAGDVFPAEPFNGMTLNYSISGVTVNSMNDIPDFTTVRKIEGTVSGGKVTVKVSGVNPSNVDSTINVQLMANGKSVSKEVVSHYGSDNGQMSVELSIDVPKGAGCEVIIDQGTNYGNGEYRGLRLVGEFLSTEGADASTVVATSSNPLDNLGPGLVIVTSVVVIGGVTIITISIRRMRKRTEPTGRRSNQKLLNKYNTTDDKLKESITNQQNSDQFWKAVNDSVYDAAVVGEQVAVITVAVADVAVDGLSNCTGGYGQVVKFSYTTIKGVTSAMAENGVSWNSFNSGFTSGYGESAVDLIKNPFYKAGVRGIVEICAAANQEGELNKTALINGLTKGLYEGGVTCISDGLFGKGYGKNILKGDVSKNFLKLDKELSSKKVGDFAMSVFLNQQQKVLANPNLNKKMFNKLGNQILQTTGKGVIKVVAEAEVKPLTIDNKGIPLF